jgi:hypothetical protein
VKLVFSRSESLGGRLIRWFTRSRWNHVRIWDPETLTMWEAMEVIRTRPGCRSIRNATRQTSP